MRDDAFLAFLILACFVALVFTFKNQTERRLERKVDRLEAENSYLRTANAKLSKALDEAKLMIE